MIDKDEIITEAGVFDIGTSNVQKAYVLGWVPAGIYGSGHFPGRKEDGMRRGFSRCLTVTALAGSLLVGCGKQAVEEPAAASMRITAVDPKLATIGAPITISGEGFGSREDHVVSIGGNGINVELEVVEWQNDRIVVKIPDDPRVQKELSYYYRVQSKDYQHSSNLFSFSFR